MEWKSQRLESIFEQTIVGIAQVNSEGRFVLVNERFCQIVGREREELQGLTMQEITHPDDLKENLLLFHDQFLSGKSFEIIKRYVRPDGSTVWVKNHVSLIREKDGSEFSVAVSLDITEQKKREEHYQAKARQDKFLANVGMVLSSSLDFNETLHQITRLAVPDFGDWCYIHLENSVGEFELIRSSAANPEIEETLTEFAKLVSSESSSLNAVKAVHKSGKAVLRNHLDDSYYMKVSGSPRQLELFRKLAPKSVIVVPLNSLGKLQGTITISYAQDISYSESELQLLEEVALRAGLALDNARLYQEANQAVASRDEFVSLASHELKTPLTSLMLLNQMARKRIKRGGPEAFEDDSLQQVFADYDSHIHRIAKLVDDMLDITHIQQGTYSLNFESADFGTFLKEVCAGYSSDIKLHGNTLDVKLRGDLQANFDRSRFYQVISNVLTNAFKYAPGSHIMINALSKGDRIRLEIRDQGPGMEPKHLEKIFHRFERISSTQHVAGLGLGLYLSRRILEAHKGTIWAESQPGQGTSIIMEFLRNLP